MLLVVFDVLFGCTGVYAFEHFGDFFIEKHSLLIGEYDVSVGLVPKVSQLRFELLESEFMGGVYETDWFKTLIRTRPFSCCALRQLLCLSLLGLLVRSSSLCGLALGCC